MDKLAASADLAAWIPGPALRRQATSTEKSSTEKSSKLFAAVVLD